jgi:hypothetical protein
MNPGLGRRRAACLDPVSTGCLNRQPLDHVGAPGDDTGAVELVIATNPDPDSQYPGHARFNPAVGRSNSNS